jgi:DNA-binding transcriptional LysR family regulator
MSKAEQIHALRTKQITIGFNRRLPVEQDIMVETVYFEPMIIAIHANSELAQYERIHCTQLQGETIILYPNATRPSFADTVTAFLRDNHVDVQYTQEAPDVVTALALVSSGFGVCITPESASRLSLPNVLYRTLDIDPQPTVELACLYRRGDDNPVLHNFLEIIRSYKHQDI